MTVSPSHEELIRQIWGRPNAAASGVSRFTWPAPRCTPSMNSVRHFLLAGWWVHYEMKGELVQVRIDEHENVTIHSKRGEKLERPLPKSIVDALCGLFPARGGPTVVVGRLCRTDETLFLFDVTRLAGTSLVHCDFAMRHGALPTLTGSRHVVALRMFKSLAAASRALAGLGGNPQFRSLVFRSPNASGFGVDGVVRCLAPGG